MSDQSFENPEGTSFCSGEWAHTDQFFHKFFLSSLDMEPFKDSKDPLLLTMSNLAWAGKFMIKFPQWPVDKTHVLIGSWGDLLADLIRPQSKMTPEEAREQIVQAVRMLVSNKYRRFFSTITFEQLREEKDQNSDTELDLEKLGNCEELELGPENALYVLRKLSEYSLPYYVVRSLDMAVHVFVSLVCKGQVTRPIIDKVQKALKKDGLTEEFHLNKRNFRKFYRTYGRCLHEETINIICDKLMNTLPDNAKHLRQAINEIKELGKKLNPNKSYKPQQNV